VSLVGADLRPELMVNNVRASVFPHLQQQVQSSIALSMSRQAWGEVEQLERLHRWKCRDKQPRLVAVQAVHEEGHEVRPLSRTTAAVSSARAAAASSSAAAASAAAATPIPPVSGTETLLSKLWSGQLWNRGGSGSVKTPAFASGSATDTSSTIKSAAPSSNAGDSSASNGNSGGGGSDSSEFVLSPNPGTTRFLSSERWLVQRCDGTQLYRVQYYGNGDAFYATVVPTNLSGLAAQTWLSIKHAVKP
jgi:hypothetical protein